MHSHSTQLSSTSQGRSVDCSQTERAINLAPKIYSWCDCTALRLLCTDRHLFIKLLELKCAAELRLLEDLGALLPAGEQSMLLEALTAGGAPLLGAWKSSAVAGAPASPDKPRVFFLTFEGDVGASQVFFCLHFAQQRSPPSLLCCLPLSLSDAPRCRWGHHLCSSPRSAALRMRCGCVSCVLIEVGRFPPARGVGCDSQR